MSFVTARPEALAAAASQLQAIGSALSAQDAATAGPTTGVAPAAADGISALTAAQFSTQGNLYQQVSAEFAAIHEKFVAAMNAAAESYAATEAANATDASSMSSPLASTLSLLGSNAMFTDVGTGASTAMMYIPSSLAPSMIGYLTAAGSTVGGSAGGIGGLLMPGGPLSALGGLGGGFSGAAGAASAAAGTISATTPAVSATMGQATLIGSLSAPQSWAAISSATQSSAATTSALQPSGWAVEPGTNSMAAMPPAVPGTGRGGFGYGTPRYGSKPTVMPRPVMVG